MERIAEIISKRVVSIEEGKSIGYILNACFNEELNIVEGYLIVDDESEKINFLPYKKIEQMCEEFILISSAEVLSFGETIANTNPINKEVLSQKGEFLGKIIDIEIYKNKVLKLITTKGEINPKKIYSAGDEFMFFSNSKKKARKRVNFVQINNFQNLPKIEIQDDKNIEKISKTPNIVEIPIKLNSSTQNIIGKMATTDIFGYNNEIIIKKDEKITEKTIKKAKKHDKLNYLLFNNR